jgi:serine/threonine-protein kinase
MNEVRWPEARALFAEAIELPAAERIAFVERRAGEDPELLAEVRSLLDSHAGAGSFLDGTDVGVLRGLDGSELLAVAGERIGPWRIVRPIGQGGMGRVYFGERATGDYEQQVAIKVVSGGLANAEIVRRFHVERRILASLEHPGIARLLDGGTTEDGLPYFVMEYVEGSGILEYADRLRLGVRARIELFLEVCAAVEHAHQRLVVHRDIKPSNILVGADGRPKLLDFGIGKLLQSGEEGESSDRTATRMRWLTPSYASPEQILGEPTTTATDVFGLGLVLFELLTGSKPHASSGGSPREIEAAILGQAPRRASSVIREPESSAAALRGASPQRLRRLLRGDLDNIVAKALERDPARRYATVTGLAADLGRYLRGEPVLARAAGAPERFRKLVLRNRAASLAIAAGLILSLALTVFYTATMRRERNLARREADTATAIASFMTRLFEGANPIQTGGAELTARDLLDRGEQQLVERTDIEPMVRARLLGTMSLARESLGDGPRARALAKQSYELHEATHSPAKDRAWALLQYAHGIWRDGRSVEALPMIERAVALAESDPDVPLRIRGSAVNLFALASASTGDVKRASGAYLRLLEIERRIGSPSRFGRALNNFGVLLNDSGDHQAARARFEESLAEYEKSTEPQAYEIYMPLFNLAELELDAGHLDIAEAEYRRGMAAHEKVFGAESTEVAYGLASIAEVERRRGQLARARESVDRSLALYALLLEPGQEDWSWPLEISGRVRLAQGDRAGAVAELERALAIERGIEGDRTHRIHEIELDLAAARSPGSPAS